MRPELAPVSATGWGGWRHALFNGNGMARRLLVAVVAFSSLITAVITAVELYRDYRHDLQAINAAFRFVESSHARSLAHSLWQFDGEAVRTQLEGLLRLPDIEFAGVEVEGQMRWTAGEAVARHRLEVAIELRREQPGYAAAIGILHVVASGDRALARVWKRALVQLLGNGIKTLLVSLFLLLVFQYMVTQHLTRVARFVRDIDPMQPGGSRRVLVLDRPGSGRWRPDILDTVADAINSLLASARQAQLAIEDSQARLAESELRFRLGMEAAGAGLWDCDVRREVVHASPECARIVGLEPADLPSTLAFWRERAHPEDLQANQSGLQAHLEGQVPQLRMEARLRHEQLGWRWTALRGRIIDRDAQGRPLRALGTLVDIEERKCAEAALLDREEKFRGIAEMNVDVIFQLVPPGVFSYVSPAARALFGFEPEEWLSSALADHVAPESRERATRLVARVLAGETVRNFELGAPRRDGAPLVLEANATPIHLGAHVVGVQGVLRDITERRRAEEALRDANRRLETRVRERTVALEAACDDAERANRAKSEFLSRMSHELRTPMNAILGFAQILETSGADARQQRWVSEIRQAGEHLLELIDELLDLARIEVGRLNVRLEPVELQPVIQEAAAMCKMAADGRQVALKLESLDEGQAVTADRTRLRQVLLNLLSNAIKYNHPGGRVDVVCRGAAPGRLRLTVRDTGTGLSPEQIGRLFQPFERLGREESGIQGSGIGLALSKQLAELMHCSLGAESVRGLGSSFWIDMPAATAGAMVQDPPAPAAVQTACRALRVLYIEDNRVNVALMRAIFESRPDLALLTAADGPSGLAVARAERPGAILLDIQLPGMSGYEVLQELRGDPDLGGVPVIAVSADAMPHDVARGLAAGFAAYVAKPIRFAELMQRLDEIAARATGTMAP
jgi:PAS domain S-box-containing protein